jgi:hypothetical protein
MLFREKRKKGEEKKRGKCERKTGRSKEKKGACVVNYGGSRDGEENILRGKNMVFRPIYSTYTNMDPG